MYTVLQCSTWFYKAHYPLSSNCNFSRMLLFIVSDPCVIHIDSLQGNRVDSKLWFVTMAIVLLISKVMSSITCNNKDKSFSHAPLNSGMTLFT